MSRNAAPTMFPARSRASTTSNSSTRRSWPRDDRPPVERRVHEVLVSAGARQAPRREVCGSCSYVDRAIPVDDREGAMRARAQDDDLATVSRTPRTAPDDGLAVARPQRRRPLIDGHEEQLHQRGDDDEQGQRSPARLHEDAHPAEKSDRIQHPCPFVRLTMTGCLLVGRSWDRGGRPLSSVHRVDLDRSACRGRTLVKRDGPEPKAEARGRACAMKVSARRCRGSPGGGTSRRRRAPTLPHGRGRATLRRR